MAFYRCVGSSSGGGGNRITYGTNAPSSSETDQDGDLYFLLSGGRKIAEFLCINGNWTLIDGSVPLMQYVFYQSRRNSDDSDTYTATNPCTLLCINQNMNGEASTQTLTSTITTTGTIIDEDVYETSFSNPNRNQCTKVAFIQMGAGDTITFSNTHTGNYTTQMHAIFDISTYVRVEGVTRVVSEAKADNSYGNTETYSLLANGLYFAYCFQSGGAGQATTYGTIECDNTDAAIIEMARGELNESLSVALTTYPDTLTFGWSYLSNYATKGYAVYKLS